MQLKLFNYTGEMTMSNIMIIDLEASLELDRLALNELVGGSGYYKRNKKRHKKGGYRKPKNYGYQIPYYFGYQKPHFGYGHGYKYVETSYYHKTAYNYGYHC